MCCYFFFTGLRLYPSTVDLTFESFTLVCDLDGLNVSDIVSFAYNGTGADACTSPPNPFCTSTFGSITPGTNTVNFTLKPSEIPLKGNALWSCSHGSQTAQLSAYVVCKLFYLKYIFTRCGMGTDFSCFFRVSRLSVHSDGLFVLPKEINQAGVLQIPFPRLII